MIIHMYGGLANRLRVLVSYAAAGYTKFRWDADGEIAGSKFEEVFCPLPGIDFVSRGINEFRTCDPLPAAPELWQEGYRLLQLKPCIMRLLGHARPDLAYGAMHIRRTDHIGYARELKNETTDEEFIMWLQGAPSHVYLATDNGTTQDRFVVYIADSGRSPYINLFISEHLRQNEGGVRNTTLAHAAIDLFICAGASSFMGTRESSFTNTITMLHELGGWWMP